MTDPIDRPYFPAEEPGAQQQGVDAPGFFSATSDFMNGGVYNGTFRLGPPQSASNIDLASSVVGSNFVPGWRFVQSSNTAITASHIRNTDAPSGSNLRFTFSAGAANDEAYVEQFIDITGSAVNSWQSFRVVYRNGSLANTKVTLDITYRQADGTLSGTSQDPTHNVTASSAALATNTTGTVTARFLLLVPAKYVQLRVRIQRNTANTSGTGDLDIYEVKRDNITTQLSLSDTSDLTWSSAYAYQNKGAVIIDPGVTSDGAQPGSDGSGSGSVLFPRGIQVQSGTLHYEGYSGGFNLATNGLVTLHGYQNSGSNFTYTNSTGGSNLIIGWQLMALTWSETNLNSGQTNARLSVPNPASSGTYLTMPFPAHLVGISLRRAGGTQTAGTIQMDLMTGTGTNVLASNIHTWSSTTAENVTYKYALGTYQWAADVPIGIRAVTSSSPALAPSGSLDVVAVMWLAVPWDGGFP